MFDAFAQCPVISIPSLRSLQIGSLASQISRTLTKLNCPSIEIAIISMAMNDDGVAQGDELGEEFAYNLPSLKKLVYQMNGSGDALRLLGSLHFPPLKECTISGFDREVEAGIETIPALNHPPLQCRQLQQLWISVDGFFLLTGILDTKFARTLHITLPESAGSPDQPVYQRAIPFPRLESLALIGRNLRLMSIVLQHLELGVDFTTLEITQLQRDAPSPVTLSKSWSVWEAFAQGAAQNGTYSSVKTLITNWPSAIVGFIHTLYDLCQNTRHLILKNVSGIHGSWPLAELEPWHEANSGKGIVLPFLEDVVIEIEKPCEMEELEALAYTYEHQLQALLASRQRAGASSFTSVTLRGITKSRFQEVELKRLAFNSGVLFHLEIVDPPPLAEEDQ
jgi:hypothetical protein